jgi:hypothetical protein
MPEQAETEGTWVPVTDFTTLAHGDRVRSTQTQFPAEHVVEGEFDKMTRSGRVMLVGRSGQYFADPRVRTWEKLTPSQAPAEPTPTWVPIDADDITVGMYVRGVARDHYSWTAEPVEGEVTALVGSTDLNLAGDFPGNGSRDKRARNWERRVTPEVVAEAMAPTPEPEPVGTWVRTAQRDLAVGDRVRVTSKARSFEVNIGAVVALDGYVVVAEDGTQRRRTFVQDYRWFDKWVVPVVSTPDPFAPVPASSFSPPQVGEVFTRTYSGGHEEDRPNCTVRSVGPRTVGEGWRVGYRAVGVTAGTVLVNPDGTLTNTSGYHPGAFVRPVAVPAHPGGWEVVTDLSTLRRGDTVRSTPDQIGGVMQAVVESTYRDTFTARTTHVIEPSGNGRDADLNGFGGGFGSQSYSYGAERGHNTIKWLGSGPAPDPAAREARLAAQAAPVVPIPEGGGSSTPLPEWATSLDAAKRHVHGVARSLFLTSENCASGTQDFMSAAGLPRYDVDYPTPVPVDESAQIREFLATVREAAISTADRHGKATSLVHRWLEREGIVEPTPPPVRHTIEIEVPHDVTAEMVRRQVRVIDGWRMI